MEQEASTSSNETIRLETCQNATYESDDSNDTIFYDALSEFEGNEDYDLSKRVSFEARNFLEYEIEYCCVDTILW